jgi:hypothetical protein
MKLINSSDPQPNKKISGLYLGDAYTGKSHNLATWPVGLVVCFDPHADTILKFPGWSVAMVETWGEFERDILPHIKNRTVSKLTGRPVGTVGVDSMSLGASRLATEVQGRKERLTKPDFGIILSKLSTAVMDMTDSCTPKEGKESYHTIFTSHLKTVSTGEGEAQRIVGIRPAIVGEFANLFPRLTSFTFICGSRVKQDRQPNQPPTESREYFVHTAPPPPDPKLYVCGNRVGDRSLPPTLGGTYPELTAAWGIPNESGLPTDRA